MTIPVKEDDGGFDSIERAMMRDDGQAAASHLRSGRPIYYCCDEYPTEIVREWPDGSRELVSVDAFGNIINVRNTVRG
jgi:hypothetical protein